VKLIAIVGGTKGIGRAVARLLAVRGDRVALLGRDAADLAASAADLAARAPGDPPATAVLDLARPETYDAALDEAIRRLGGLDAVVITAGAFGTQDALEADAAARQRVLSTNFTDTIQFCEVARARLLAGGGGTLCVLGSVAGDRARKPVVLYGATKAGLAYYLQGIDLRHRDAGLRVVLVKPGFVRTGSRETEFGGRTFIDQRLVQVERARRQARELAPRKHARPRDVEDADVPTLDEVANGRGEAWRV